MGEVEFTQDDLDIFQVVSTQRVPAIWYYSGLCIIHWPGPSPRQAVRQDQEKRAEVQGGAGGGQLPECGAPTRSAGGKNSQKRSKTWNSRFARFWMRELWSLKTTKTSPLKCETAALKISKQCLANCSYTFYATGMDDMTKVRKAIFMFTDLFGMERFDYRTVVTFFVGEHKEPPDLKSRKCESFVSLVRHLITKRLNLGKAH